jgi:hypothetical protein
MYPETVVEAWESYYKENGLSWLAPQVQAAIKQAFFAGMEAVEQGVQSDECEACRDKSYVTLGNGNVICWYCGRIRR